MHVEGLLSGISVGADMLPTLPLSCQPRNQPGAWPFANNDNIGARTLAAASHIETSLPCRIGQEQRLTRIKQSDETEKKLGIPKTRLPAAQSCCTAIHRFCEAKNCLCKCVTLSRDSVVSILFFGLGQRLQEKSVMTVCYGFVQGCLVPTNDRQSGMDGLHSHPSHPTKPRLHLRQYHSPDLDLSISEDTAHLMPRLDHVVRHSAGRS